MRQRRRCHGLALVAVVVLVVVGCTSQRPPAPDEATLKGKRIELIIPNQPGQSMDSYGRMIVPYLDSCLGTSRIIVRNLTGAGGIRGTNELAKAEPDGLTIAFTSMPALVLAHLADSEGVQFDPQKLTYLGRVSTEPRVLGVGTKSGLTGVDDLKALNRPFVFPSQGTDEDFFTMAVLADALDFPLKIVTGYTGNADTALAVVSGKADGQITALSSAEPMLKAKDKRAVLMVASKRVDGYPDVPTASEAAPDDASLRAITSMLELHRGFFAPPGMDAKLAKQLRAGVACALAKPELRKKAEQAGLPIVPLAGDEVQREIRAIYGDSATLKPVLTKSLEAIQ